MRRSMSTIYFVTTKKLLFFAQLDDFNSIINVEMVLAGTSIFFGGKTVGVKENA